MRTGAHPPALGGCRQDVTATGSGRTSTVSATSTISVAGMSTRDACPRIFSGLEAS